MRSAIARLGVLVVAVSSAAPASAADMVITWNNVLLATIRADKTPPPLAARNMAIVHVAIYDAVNAITRTHEPYAFGEKVPRGASPEAAVAAAAHRTLVALYPALEEDYDDLLAESLEGIPPGRAKLGVAIGQAAADAILALHSDDGINDVVPYTPGGAPGDWKPTPPLFLAPLFPQWPGVTPFCMTSGDQFLPEGPPALTSAAYTADFNEVKSLGKSDSATRTAEQTEIAFFWADGPGTATPPGHWNVIAQDVAIAKGTTLAENARLFALLNLAVADAGISCWDAKYFYDFWRPITAIREADTDGNPATTKDATWSPLITTPNFPTYTSGHSTFSGASATILANFFGTDDVSFTTSSDGLPGVTRSFDSFSEAAQEAAVSRLYGGIHFTFDNDDGKIAGGMLGAYVFDNFLRPLAKKK